MAKDYIEEFKINEDHSEHHNTIINSLSDWAEKDEYMKELYKEDIELYRYEFHRKARIALGRTQEYLKAFDSRDAVEMALEDAKNG